MTLLPPIIFDMGSSTSRIGVSGVKEPKTTFSTVVGYQSSKSVLNQDTKDFYVGEQAQLYRDRLNLKYPIENGVVNNWDDMEKIYHWSFGELSLSSHGQSILITEPPLNPKDHREKLTQLMFETFGVPSLYLGVQPVLAMHHLAPKGNKTGIVVDIGDTCTYVVPMYQGHQIGHGVEKFPVAGRNITDYLTQLLSEKGFSLTSSAQKEIVKDIKEKYSSVALDYEASLLNSKDNIVPVDLPDGQTIQLGVERFKSSEILFQSSMIGVKTNLPWTVSKVLLETCKYMGSRIRKDWASDIWLTGGTSCIPGIDQRLQQEVSKLLLPDPQIHNTATLAATASALSSAVRVKGGSERKMDSFLGASEIGSLTNFGEMSVWKSEYFEVGPSIVGRVCY